MKINMRNIICVGIISLLLHKPLFSDLIGQNLYCYNSGLQLVKNMRITDLSSETNRKKKSFDSFRDSIFPRCNCSRDWTFLYWET